MSDNDAGPNDIRIRLAWGNRTRHEADGSDLVPTIEIEDARSGLTVLEIEMTPTQFHQFMGGRLVDITPSFRIRAAMLSALGKFHHHRSGMIPAEAVETWDRSGEDAALEWAKTHADVPEDSSLSVSHLRDGWQWLARWYRDEPMVREAPAPTKRAARKRA